MQSDRPQIPKPSTPIKARALCVKNCPPGTTWQEVASLFEKYGSVQFAQMSADGSLAEVVMKSVEDLKPAMGK